MWEEEEGSSSGQALAHVTKLIQKQLLLNTTLYLVQYDSGIFSFTTTSGHFSRTAVSPFPSAFMRSSITRSVVLSS